jgi:hypothetical protein
VAAGGSALTAAAVADFRAALASLDQPGGYPIPAPSRIELFFAQYVTAA